MKTSKENAGGFLGNEITFVQDQDGNIHVPLKRLCEAMEIGYEEQRSKVRSDDLGAELMLVPGEDGRHRKMLCLPIEEVGNWASTIDPETLSPEVRKAISELQEEASEDEEECEGLVDEDELTAYLDAREALWEKCQVAAKRIVAAVRGCTPAEHREIERTLFKMITKCVSVIWSSDEGPSDLNEKTRIIREFAQTDFASWLQDLEDIASRDVTQ
jgi:hypothetical protein